MKSKPIKRMEDITNIPPLGKRRECKAMIQATKYQCSQDRPIHTRLKQLSSGRLQLYIRDKSITKKPPGSSTYISSP